MCRCSGCRMTARSLSGRSLIFITTTCSMSNWCRERFPIHEKKQPTWVPTVFLVMMPFQTGSWNSFWRTRSAVHCSPILWTHCRDRRCIRPWRCCRQKTRWQMYSLPACFLTIYSSVLFWFGQRMVNWDTTNCTIIRWTQSPLSAVICDSVRFSLGYAAQRCSGFFIPY